MAGRKPLPKTEQPEKELPSAEQKTVELPSEEMPEKELPKPGNPENTVIIGGTVIEIKATKMKYERNRSALFYKVLETIPVVDVVSYGVGVFDADRDGDKCVFDFLVAATDNEALIRKNYNEMTSEDIEMILQIFKRVNRIDEKEEKQRKNLETATKESRSKKPSA